VGLIAAPTVGVPRVIQRNLLMNFKKSNKLTDCRNCFTVGTFRLFILLNPGGDVMSPRINLLDVFYKE
jgi:hypothetical protein